MKVLAIIPARAGSKRLPGKNWKILGDKPLIKWTVETAQKSKLIDEIFVSTDSRKVAKESGLEVSYFRRTSLAQDDSTPVEYIKDTLKEFPYVFDIVTILQPTSPFRTPEMIDESIKLLIKTEASSIISYDDTFKRTGGIYTFWVKNIRGGTYEGIYTIPMIIKDDKINIDIDTQADFDEAVKSLG